MSELQAEQAEAVESVILDDAEEVETEQAVEPSDSAPDTGESQEQKVEFSEEQQKIFDDAISKKVFKAKEAEREAEKLRKELEEVRAKLPKEAKPEVPPIPDPYDEDYEEKIAARDQALKDLAAYEVKQQERERQERELLQRQQQEAEKALVETYEGYKTRAEAAGISAQELDSIAQTINQFEISADLGTHIMQDEMGPQVAKYLAKNVVELDSINKMSLTKAAIYIENVVKPKAAIKPKVTTAPEPVEHLSGAGVSTEGGPKGATFE